MPQTDNQHSYRENTAFFLHPNSKTKKNLSAENNKTSQNTRSRNKEHLSETEQQSICSNTPNEKPYQSPDDKPSYTPNEIPSPAIPNKKSPPMATVGYTAPKPSSEDKKSSTTNKPIVTKKITTKDRSSPYKK